MFIESLCLYVQVSVGNRWLNRHLPCMVSTITAAAAILSEKEPNEKRDVKGMREETDLKKHNLDRHPKNEGKS